MWVVSLDLRKSNYFGRMAAIINFLRLRDLAGDVDGHERYHSPQRFPASPDSVLQLRVNLTEKHTSSASTLRSCRLRYARRVLTVFIHNF